MSVDSPATPADPLIIPQEHRARRDVEDFRDRMFVPPSLDIPSHIPLEDYRKLHVPILDQGEEHACTGFGLAAVVHYFMRRHVPEPNLTPVSPRMLYEMAKRYDEWPGANYEGSSARGAMKGWHKHGVCAEALWPYRPGDTDRRLTHEREIDAQTRPLGAYYRVKGDDIAAVRGAIAEVGVVYVTAGVHDGWHRVGPDGVIPFPGTHLGSHAFALVAYDHRGFWLQNSKGPSWGREGYGYLSVEDWLANHQDAWVAYLGDGPADAAAG
jgi:hypothetical protein